MFTCFWQHGLQALSGLGLWSCERCSSLSSNQRKWRFKLVVCLIGFASSVPSQPVSCFILNYPAVKIKTQTPLLAGISRKRSSLFTNTHPLDLFSPSPRSSALFINDNEIVRGSSNKLISLESPILIQIFFSLSLFLFRRSPHPFPVPYSLSLSSFKHFTLVIYFHEENLIVGSNSMT